VELDLTRYEMSLSRTLSETWDAVLRVPWFQKDQRAEVLFHHQPTAAERAAALLSGYNHHRSQSYEGLGDLELSLGWRKADILGEGSVLRVGLGLTLPTGDTEDDPLRAGDEGREHLHIQFGNGSVDPLLDFYLGLPVAEKLGLSLYGKTRLPFYQTSKGYHASAEATLIPRLTWLPTKRLSVSVGTTLGYFGYAEWNDVRDPNSGQFVMNALVGIGCKVTDELTASASLLLPLFTKTFAGEDTLDPAPVVSVSVARIF
jgi:hypothetical protein